MKKPEGKKKLIILLIATLVIGALLMFSVYYATKDSGELTLNGLIRSEMLYLMAIVLLSIPVLLVALVFAAAFGKNKQKTLDLTGLVSNAEQNAENKTGERFSTLNEIDGKEKEYGYRSYEKNVSLEKFCERFRDFAASRLKLYYEMDDIRSFVS